MREGMRVFAFNARSGPLPLSPGVVEVIGVRGVMPESVLGVVVGKGLSGGCPALHALL